MEPVAHFVLLLIALILMILAAIGGLPNASWGRFHLMAASLSFWLLDLTWRALPK